MDNEKGQSKPTKTWFIERGDGQVFATDEHDAWNLLTDKSQWRRHDFKIVGVSDGETYFKTIRNGANEMNELITEKERLNRDLQKYTQTEDRLRFTELKDDTDEMVIKVTKIVNDLKDKLGSIDKQLADFNRTIISKAFQAELEKARGNIEFPANHDIITPNKADRDKVLANLHI